MSAGAAGSPRQPPGTGSVWSWGGTSGAGQGRLVEVRAELAGDREVGQLDAGRILSNGWLSVPWETRDRLRAAIINSSEQWPTPVLFAVRPASATLSRLDAAFAVAVLSAAGELPRRRSRLGVIGELGLDGRLRVGDGHAMAVAAAAAALPAAGVRRLVVPAALASLPADRRTPARLGRRPELVGVEDLTELVSLLRAATPGGRPARPASSRS